MKICYSTLAFMPATELGGPVYNSYHLAKSLVGRGHQITVCCTNLANRTRKLFTRTERRLYDGIDVIYFDTHKLIPLGVNSFGPFVCPDIIRFCRTELKSCDLVHLDGYRDFLTAVLSYFCRRYGIPYVIQARGSLHHGNTSVLAKGVFDRLIGHRILAGSALCIASSEDEASQYRAIVPGPKNVAVIYNGLDFESYSSLPPRGGFRARHDIHTRYLITYLGRVHPQKGIDTLIKAFAISRHRQEARLAIIGPDQRYKATLTKLSEDLAVKESVLFVDPIAGQDKNEAFVDSDVVVYAGKSESFGMVAFEATMCGVPVITAGNSGCSELLERSGAQHVTKYGDSTQLASVIDDVLALGNEAHQRARSAARDLRRLLSWDNIAGEYEEAYMSASRTPKDLRYESSLNTK
jgi:glycosyltransferase involved in cell wall biosynthesis